HFFFCRTVGCDPKPFRCHQYPDEQCGCSRQRIEHRWSFAEICQSLKRSGEGLDKFGHMLFNYGMSSHIAHQDIDGIGMVWDRNQRCDKRRSAVELAHAARLVSDVSVMSLLRLKMILTRCGCDYGPLKSL